MQLSDRSPRPSLEELALTRRGFMAGGLTAGLALAWSRPVWALPERERAAGLATIAHDAGDRIVVPEGYAWRVVLAWGDPILPEAPAFDPAHPTAAAQEQQFGFNNDFVGFLPLPWDGSDPQRALLAVNHEYTNPELMHPGWAPDTTTREQLALELAAHGLSVVELRRRQDGGWEVAPPGPLNRRITGKTPLRFTGPAAGSPLLRTQADPEGRTVLGMLNNCSGGVTPWGTVLTCEENVDQYFSGTLPAEDLDPRVAPWHERYTIGAAEVPNSFAKLDPRFDLAQAPHEAFRFGWVVEIDPFDPASTPRKHTALGRFKHEAANVRLASDGRAVVYMGDDTRFEYLYKFVSEGTWDGKDRAGARGLLERGTLYSATFGADGRGEWRPLVHGQGPLTAENGFHSQADVLIAARLAADLVGATPMDRPEDVEPSPVTGRVYVALTNNTKRKPDQLDGPNPRARNAHGQLLELREEGDDAAALTFAWDVLLLGGDPADADSGAAYGEGSPTWLSCPDNLAFDAQGRLFVTTDGQTKSIKKNDGLYVVGTEGAERGQVRQLLSGVPGGECAGPCPTPDGKACFVSIQHPAEGSHRDQPTSRFPDYQEGLPPRPAVVVLWREDGGRVGD